MAAKKKRITTAADTIQNRQEFDEQINAVCKLQLKQEQRINLRDRLLADIREEHDGEIERLSELITAKIWNCRHYADVNREEIFQGKIKQAASSLGLFGFRTGNPTLALIKRKGGWAGVLQLIKDKSLPALIRTKEEPDKEALHRLPTDELETLNLKKVQAESFYIEPKRDNPERIQTN